MITIMSILKDCPILLPGCSPLSFNSLPLKCDGKGYSEVLFTEAQGHHLMYLKQFNETYVPRLNQKSALQIFKF